MADAIDQLSIAEADTPLTFHQAVTDPKYGTHWRISMESEIMSLNKSDTWSIIPREEVPIGKKIVKGKWIYKIKLDASRNPTRLKSRYVAKGFSQVKNEDFFEIFSPVGRKTTLRSMLAFAACN